MRTGNQVSINIFPDRPRSRIAHNLFGLHLEHIWNCVYPCVWVGSESPVDNVAGIREEAIRLLSALRPSVCKYPGGYFSDFHDWRDGVGPPERRPVRPCPTQPGCMETNQFGTAEFVTFCRLIGAQPYISVNTTSIEPNVAAEWVEYCNRADSVAWAERRRDDGYDEPFEVKYWAVGNEPYWLHSADEYANRYRRWVHWMYNTDPTIAIVAGGVEPGQCVAGPWNRDGRWGERFLEITGGASDLFPARWHPPAGEREMLYSFHPYFSSNPACNTREYRAAFEELTARLTASIKQATALLDHTRGQHPRPKLCFDEYGLLFPGTRMDGNMTQPAPFWSALWLAAFFHLCFEYADSIGMANLPGSINMEHELVLAEGGKLVTSPSYHLFRLYRRHGGSDSLECHIVGAPPEDLLLAPPLLMAASRLPGRSELTVSLLNLDLDRPLRVRISLAGHKARPETAELLYHPDIYAQNSAQNPAFVVPTVLAVEADDHGLGVVIPEHSVAVLGLTMK